MRQYVLHVLIAIDQLINTLVGGYPDETLSASAYLGEMQGKLLPKFFRPIIDAIFFFDPQHCQKAYLAEVRREQSP